MKITVNGGHTPTSPGARKYLDEVKCDRAVKDALRIANLDYALLMRLTMRMTGGIKE